MNAETRMEAWKQDYSGERFYTRLVSVENAPASLKCPLETTQNIRWGEGWEYGAGRGRVARRINSRPLSFGKVSLACGENKI